MLEVIMTKGLPGSGKSTWAKEVIEKNPNTYKRINKDDLRSMLDCGKWSDDSEKFIIQVRNTLILLALINNKHVIIDDTNLAPKHEEVIRQLIKGKAKLVIQDFTDVPLETCIKNDLKRFSSVGEKVIKQMYDQYLKPVTEIIQYDSELADVIICDLDGTLAQLNGRNPYDASTCENDLLDKTVASILVDKQVILVSGREDKYRRETISFLDKHKIEWRRLYMRESGDMRKDSIIKKEIFDKYIRGQFNVKFVLDDRNQVVEMWRSIGLKCLQVQEGNF